MGRNFIWSIGGAQTTTCIIHYFSLLCDLLFIMNDTNFVSYTDNNTPYIVGQTDVIDKLQNHSGQRVLIPSLIFDSPILKFGSSPVKPFLKKAAPTLPSLFSNPCY